MAATGKIERKYMAHFINAVPAGPAEYERLGKDLEELSIEMNPNVETKKNILGETSILITGYERSGSVEPFYAEKGSKLFEFLQGIIDANKTLDELKTDAVEVHLWEEAAPESTYPAYKETVYIEVTSYGGDTTGYQIPFTLHYVGDRVKGTFNISTKAFTANGS